MAIDLDPRITAFQNEWRFCNYCHCLWWNGIPAGGTCTSPNAPHGAHDADRSWNFYLPASPEETLHAPPLH